ncbi:PilN family type IVB pilus formation outer membrane protein [Paraburkholderia megapolitana]|uniref:Type IVB pilus formation outer membrane protein, R64 PilN family n=1 Tax=Paraburkholderia megapolitana TaxID=420953 RepID=A0A1I3DVH9_9BURK|nr:PilN family type IVB pilus formation outer membrane protein [Paraburkholderia megapolitana]QDQ79788.1 PilN family type IVB pilus formation outer membrane protein [Paraburkholderia megapolitana]SFH90737.1 type IVB pilus formation outer membrane protein, R64 PilN family [Paraburkholderia megapolitana]
MRVLRQVAVIGVSLCVLAGCTGLLQNVQHDTQADMKRQQGLLDGVNRGDNREHDTDAVVTSDGLWLSGNTLKLASSTTLPGVFNEPASFDGTVDSLRAFADRITRMTNIPAKVAPGTESAVMQAIQGGSSTGAATSATYPGLPPLPAGMMQGSSTGGARGAAMAPDLSAVHIVYPHGDLRGLLDAASARFGVFWKYANGSIEFFYTETRVFQVSAIPGDSKLDANVVSSSSSSGSSGGGGGGGGGSGSASGGSSGSSGGSGSTPSVSSDNTANTTMKAQLSVYTGLNATIKTMLSPAGSVVTSPGTGSITVTDTPDVLARVGEFMDQQNRVLSRQILVNVTVLSVTLSAGDSYGINWSAVYQALGTRFTFGNNLFQGLTTNPVSQANSELSASVLTPNSRANATTAMITALSGQGTVRRKTSASVTTLNDQPVPVQVATMTTYLASVSTTNTANVGSQTSLTPGSVTTGFNLTLLPHILDDGTVMMQFYTNISTLELLQNASSGVGANQQTIQLPTIDTRNFLQRVSMKSGQTLVIGGYEGVVDNGSQNGTLTPSNYLFGGGYNAQRSREVIVILITPVTTNGA